jgi:hypothetical protein
VNVRAQFKVDPLRQPIGELIDKPAYLNDRIGLRPDLDQTSWFLGRPNLIDQQKASAKSGGIGSADGSAMIASAGQPRAEMTAILHPRADPNVTAAPKKRH